MADTMDRPIGPSEPAGSGMPGPFIVYLPDDAFGQDALTLAEQSAGIGVWSIDLTTGLVRATAQFFRTMGLEPASERIPMDAIRALRHPDDRDRVIDGFRQALSGGTDSYEVEYRIIRPDGQVRWIFGRGRIVRDHDGRPVRYSGVDLDITDRKTAEAALATAKLELEQMNRMLEERVRERTAELEAEVKLRAEAEIRLHQAQKMEAVGQLTGGIAHDFNNILQVIMGNLEIARLSLQRLGVRDGAGVQPMFKAIETAQRASRSAGQLVQRLLAFSRLQTLEPTSLDVNALISDMADMIARTLGETIEVETVLSDQVWTTFADRNQLESALLNLVVNARDAMPEGGRLMIETANVEIDDTIGEDLTPGQYVVISVTDTGCGIAKDLLNKVFEPFFTTKDVGMGSGLGLSMVYGFVKQSRGHVRLCSEVGSGSAVKVYLPRSLVGQTIEASKPLDGASASGGAIAKARPGETLLVVEDNDDVRRLGVAALQSLGYRVLEAGDGPSALRLLDGADSPRIDLLFTDVVLPGGMSGRSLADEMVKRLPGLPVLFTSGYTRNAISRQGRLVPDVRILAKPYALESLATHVRQAIDAAGASD
ncbi:MAG: PAS domain-containing protein [Betaproteobacteria bacterium]